MNLQNDFSPHYSSIEILRLTIVLAQAQYTPMFLEGLQASDLRCYTQIKQQLPEGKEVFSIRIQFKTKIIAQVVPNERYFSPFVANC